MLHFVQRAFFEALLVYAVLIAGMTHCDVGIVAAEHNLATLGDDVTVFIDTRVDGCFFTAGAYGLDLGNRVRYLKKTHRAGEELGQKVRTQTEAHYRYVDLVYDAP